MAKFSTENGDLFIDGVKVLQGWESFTGWYWFGTKIDHIQDSILEGKVVKDDKIWYGFVQGFEEEWGYFSQSEIEALGPMKVWSIPKDSLQHSGRRS